MILSLRSALLGIVLASSVIESSLGKQLPRGVSPEDAALYTKAQFTCKDGSATMPSSRVNDDYCDCADGSDEPGTSACLNGVFYCRNKGYEAKILKSMYVDDGVCDCCDGTDEPQGVCANSCREIGEELLKELERDLNDAKAGLAKREGLKKSVLLTYVEPIFFKRVYIYIVMVCGVLYAGRRRRLLNPGRSVWSSWKRWRGARLSKRQQQKLKRINPRQSWNV